MFNNDRYYIYRRIQTSFFSNDMLKPTSLSLVVYLKWWNARPNALPHDEYIVKMVLLKRFQDAGGGIWTHEPLRDEVTQSNINIWASRQRNLSLISRRWPGLATPAADCYDIILQYISMRNRIHIYSNKKSTSLFLFSIYTS
jgi:hypothetical protein